TALEPPEQSPVHSARSALNSVLADQLCRGNTAQEPELQDPLQSSDIPSEQSRGQQALGAAPAAQRPRERPKDFFNRITRTWTRHAVFAVPRPEHDARTVLDPLLPEECARRRL